MAFNSLIPSSSAIPSNLNVRNGFNYIASLNSGLISDKFSIGGFVFDYAGEVSSELRADITDHYTEDNTVIQDHIALTPIRVTMRGFVGELAAGPTAGGIEGLLGGLQSGLTVVNAYIGGKTPQAISKASKAITQVQKVTTQISSAASKFNSLQKYIGYGALSSTKQSEAYKKLEAMWELRVPFTIRTPYRIYDDMVIESLKATQPEDSKYISEFIVTLKQIRMAEVFISRTNPENKPKKSAKANAQAKAPKKNNGPDGSKKVAAKIEKKVSGGGFAITPINWPVR